MRRLLEPCWWILFLKITSSVLHYVVCFPGECQLPRGRGPGRRAQGMRSCCRGTELGGPSRRPWRGWRGAGHPGGRERAAPLALVVFREAAGWGEWKKGLAGEEGRGLRMSVFARLWEAWGSRSLEKGDLLC